MITETLVIDGMSCDACVRHVTNALKSLPGVESAEVSLTEGKAIVRFNPELVTVPVMIGAVVEEGYEASK